MAEKEDGHRAYTAERKAKIIRLKKDIRSSDSLLAEFVANPDQVATKYGLKLTEGEVSALVGGQELTDEALAEVAGGLINSCNANCNC